MTTTETSRYAEAHAKQSGPGDARPTALQIVKDEEREGNMQDKVVLITGCSSGLGVETARAMKVTGAKFFVTARNLEKAKEALGDILEGGRVHVLKLDLESFKSIRSCVEEFKSKSNTLNILIENAGIRHVPLGTNHLSHFLLFELLRPTLLASSTPEFCSRAVIVSSTAHRNAPMDFGDLNWEKRKYDRAIAYGQSKLANVYTASEIERRYGAQGLHAWSVHPGGIRTGLQTGSGFDIKDWRPTSVWAAVSRDLEGQGGKYCERNRFSEPLKQGWKMIDPGHAEWAYDEAAAARLYDLSLKEIGA
ncbi:NAD(P)-binding protein [Trichoderma austrokoningii]